MCTTMSKELDPLLRDWASLGACFNVQPDEPSAIDIERLLLDTARTAPTMARLFIMAASWLNTFGDTIAKHRLARLIRDELEEEHQAVLGLLLETAQQGTHPLEFDAIIRPLQPEESPKPLFDHARGDTKLSAIVRDRASELTRKWGLWAQPVEFKFDAIRPAVWVMARHPYLRTRADFRGDLRASVLAALRHDENAGESEIRLAKLAGGSRSQIRNAICNLQLTGRVSVGRAEGANRLEIVLNEAA